tara:strand:- start:1295 stop:2614 length:1320 start_codon:yes stop_codon:yes gene_type:complete
MVDVLLINSPLFRNKVTGYTEDSLPPLGLAYIGTELKKKGFDVDLLDTVSKNMPLDEIIKYIESLKPRFTGLNIFSTNFDLVQEILENINTKTHFLIGGQVTKNTHQRIIQFKTENPLDVVLGDGEYITPELVEGDPKEQPLYFEDQRRVFRVDASSTYFPQDISKLGIDRSFFENEPIENKFGQTEANIITSRGCMYNCAFCGAARSLNKGLPIRTRSEESIREEVDQLSGSYEGLDSIRVLDDLFLRTVEDIDKAARIFRNTSYWRTMAHALSFRNAQQNDFQTLSRSGCFEIFIGIESGSQKTLKNINKSHDIEYIKKTIENLVSSGIHVKGYFIYGFPQETEAEMEETYTLAQQLKQQSTRYSGNFTVSVFQFRPYHGTILYQRMGDDARTLRFNRNTRLKLQRRSQFNFHAGNFSNASDEIVESYVKKTMLLNQ